LANTLKWYAKFPSFWPKHDSNGYSEADAELFPENTNAKFYPEPYDFDPKMFKEESYLQLKSIKHKIELNINFYSIFVRDFRDVSDEFNQLDRYQILH